MGRRAAERRIRSPTKCRHETGVPRLRASPAISEVPVSPPSRRAGIATQKAVGGAGPFSPVCGEAVAHFGRWEPEGLLGHHVGDCSLAAVLVVCAGEDRAAIGNQVLGGAGEKAPEREGPVHVVDHGRAVEMRRPAGARAETPGDRVSEVLAVGQHGALGDALRQLQPEAEVRARRCSKPRPPVGGRRETCSAGLSCCQGPGMLRRLDGLTRSVVMIGTKSGWAMSTN